MERANHAERIEIQLPRLQLKTEPVGEITQKYRREIGIPGLWADAGELRKHDADKPAIYNRSVVRTGKRLKRGEKVVAQSLIERDDVLEKHICILTVIGYGFDSKYNI